MRHNYKFKAFLDNAFPPSLHETEKELSPELRARTQGAEIFSDRGLADLRRPVQQLSEDCLCILFGERILTETLKSSTSTVLRECRADMAYGLCWAVVKEL